MDEFIVFELEDNLFLKSFAPILNNGNYEIFHDVNEVTTFMWGRSNSKYVIYKNGKRAKFTWMYGDINDLKNYLDGDIDCWVEINY